MIIDISDFQFKHIFDNNNLFLPIRWNGSDFVSTLEKLFHLYQNQINYNVDMKKDPSICEKIKTCCSYITKAVKLYLNGFPSDAFSTFKKLMYELCDTPLKLYQKSIRDSFEDSWNSDSLNLFRVVGVNDNIPYTRTRVFHTPYNLRSKVSTSRFSIAGYPSLYLGTSIELCEEEVRLNPYDKFELCSLFKLERNLNFSNIDINVIELALKPQDFFEDYSEIDNLHHRRVFKYSEINTKRIRNAYLLWYPLIASCSFIRVNKSDPFAVEYIIPQLLMQWIRAELKETDCEYEKLIGIRYFSCASQKASDMGFNYVFPTSGKQDSSLPFCSVLMNAFKLTRPVFVNEYDSQIECEQALIKSELDYVQY